MSVMIIITSPAKTFDWHQPIPKIPTTQPEYLNKANHLAKLLGSYTQEQLKHQLNVSDTLAKLNFKRYKDWQNNPLGGNVKPSLFAYRGDIFRELKLATYSLDMIEYLQNSLRILSGLYGILRPLDDIQQYRLEMKTKLSETNITSLSTYWLQDVTASLNKALKNHQQKIVLNLASKEYAMAVDKDALDGNFLQIVFHQIKNGETKNYGLMAKRARGKMINFLTQQQAQFLDMVKQFDDDGYTLHDDKQNTLTFIKHI